MSKNKDLVITNFETGEIKSLDECTNNEIGKYYRFLNTKRKELERIVDGIKNYIKKNRIDDLEWKEDKQDIGGILVSKYYRYSFDEKKLLKSGTSEELEIYNKWKKIEKKYQKGTEVQQVK